MKYQTPERKIKTITITLTQSCNLKCSYCYENNKSPKVMTFNVAQQIIDKSCKTRINILDLKSTCLAESRSYSLN